MHLADGSSAERFFFGEEFDYGAAFIAFYWADRWRFLLMPIIQEVLLDFAEGILDSWRFCVAGFQTNGCRSLSAASDHKLFGFRHGSGFQDHEWSTRARRFSEWGRTGHCQWHMFLNNGYTNAMAGNVLLAFAVGKGDQDPKQLKAADLPSASPPPASPATSNQDSSERRTLH